MQKSITLSLFICFIATFGSAQPFVRAGLGLNTAHYKFSSSYQDAFIQATGATYETQSGSGFQAGLGGGLELGPHASLIVEANFVQRKMGWTTQENYSVTVTDPSGNTSTVLGFPVWNERVTDIQVPVYFRYTLLEGRFSPTLAVGLSFNASFKGKGDYVIETQNKTYPEGDYALKFGAGRTDDYKSFDVAVNLRPGLLFKIDDDGIMKLTLDANFSTGLTDLVSQSRKDFLAADGIDILGTQKNRSSLFNLGFEFCFSCE